jgi:hypothetical protein
MRITTGLVLSLLGVCAAAQAGQPPALACNPKALTRAARPRYQEISRRLREAVRDREKLPNGYALSLDGKAISLTEAAEWMSLERLCCPFLTLGLLIEAVSGQGDWVLTLTGPSGVKPIIEAAFVKKAAPKLAP